MLNENIGLGEIQTDLVDILKAIDPFNNDNDKELGEELPMTSSPQDDES